MEIREASTVPVYVRYPILRAFKHRNFRIFFAGQSISSIGTWSQAVAIYWLVWRLTGEPFWLGFVGFAIQIPMLMFGLVGGACADRLDRLRALTILQTLCIAQAIALATLTFTGVVRLWHVMALAFFLGVVNAFELPPRQAFVMDMVGKRDLLNAVSLNAAMLHSSRIVGPVAAGFIVGLAGEGMCFAFNAATFLALIAALLMIDRDTLIIPRRQAESFWQAVWAGLHYILREPSAKLALVVLATISIAGFPFVALMPIFADKIYGGGAIQLGLLIGASATGALLGALTLARIQDTDGLLVLCSKAACFFGVSLFIFSRMEQLWLGMATLLLVGFSSTIIFWPINTLLQHVAPDHLRGRMMSLFTIAFMGMAPFGSLAAGIAARWIGAPNTVAAGAIICLVLGIIAWTKARGMKQP
jgi:MFS family permease